MGEVFGAGYLAVMLVIFVAVNSAIRKGVKGGKVPAGTAKPMPRQLRSSVPKAKPSLPGREKSGKLVDSPVLLEDREHDWLAKQLREEARLMRRGDMLDLGASHSKACDAGKIKSYHILQHDDSIDNGEM